jgi:hypothetical protein
LAQLLREEKVKWYQRGKAKHLLQGDMNTKYFQLLDNGKHRKNRIFQLQEGGRTIVGDEALKKHITSYYKELFSKPIENNFRLYESFKEDIPQVTERENDILTQPFSDEEVKNAIFQMEHNKTLGLDVFPVKFYQVFWELIKDDLLALFHDFYEGDMSLYSLNFGTIILLPKCKEASTIQ